MDSAREQLHMRAARAGLLVHWHDAQGTPHVVDPDTLQALLACLPDDDREVDRNLDGNFNGNPPMLVTIPGERITLPGQQVARHYALHLEAGAVLTGSLRCDSQSHATLTAPHSIGYHTLEIGERIITLAVAPTRCFGVQNALRAAGQTDTGLRTHRPWGIAVQLYGLRRNAATGMGDFTALAQMCRHAAREGADAISINPVHAGFAALPERYSPYAPSSRLFLNPLYADPASTFGEPAYRTAIAALGLGDTFSALDTASLIDWQATAHARYAILRWLHARRATLLSPAMQNAFAHFRTMMGDALQAHACFEALQATHVMRGEPPQWQAWPQGEQTPHDAAIARFAGAHEEEVDFHAFAQWLAATGLEQAQHHARSHGMAIGIVADLAVGTDPGGSHAWWRRDEMLENISVGAPPDLYNRHGQNWGVCALSPSGMQRRGFRAFLEMLRANLSHTGGLRIDHALGLERLWLIPAGFPADRGAYLRYPLESMLRLVALESWRHHTIIIGENLGTIPATFEATRRQHGMLGIDVLWFRRHPQSGAPDAPAAFDQPVVWDRTAIGTTTTHDLPTVAGWWAGRDIDWQCKLGLLAPDTSEAELRAVRRSDRHALWQALARAGLVRERAPEAIDAMEDAPLDATLAFVGQAPTAIRLVPIEDLLGLPEQPNLPGTVSGHPNWQRRIPADVNTMFEATEIHRRIAALRTGTTGLPS